VKQSFGRVKVFDPRRSWRGFTREPRGAYSLASGNDFIRCFADRASALIHAKLYEPMMEGWFRSVRMQLLPLLTKARACAVRMSATTSSPGTPRRDCSAPSMALANCCVQRKRHHARPRVSEGYQREPSRGMAMRHFVDSDDRPSPRPAVTKIATEMNDERVSTKVRLKAAGPSQHLEYPSSCLARRRSVSMSHVSATVDRQRDNVTTQAVRGKTSPQTGSRLALADRRPLYG
jgi:hypothetical protein